MKDFLSQRIACLHCWHYIHLDLDASMADQDYYEDCIAGCNLIHLNMHIDYARNKLELHVDSDDEQIFQLCWRM